MILAAAAAIMVIFFHGRSGDVHWRERRRMLRRMFAAIVGLMLAYIAIAVFIAKGVW